MSPKSASPIDSARAHYRQGRIRDAHGLCMQVLRADPRAAAAYGLLGEIAADHRTFDKGEELFRRAWALEPGNIAFGAGLSRCLIGLNRTIEALAAAERSLSLGSGDAATLDTLGVVFSRAGRQDLAATCFRAAHGLSPNHAGYLLNLGWAEQYLGDLAAAEAAWRKAIALDPDDERPLAALVQMIPQTADGHFIDRLERLFDRAAGDADRRLRIGHALAKTYEDLADPVASFDWLARAKAAKAGPAANLDLWRNELFAAARATAPRQGEAGAGHTSDEPIFVFGLPRSGTTLVEQMVASHPAVVSTGEPMDFAILARRLAGAPTRELIDGPTLRTAARGDMARLGADYVASIRARQGGGARFTDKAPLNFLYAGLIHAALPNARMICLRRDPIDSCLAIYRQMFATSFAYYDWVYSLEATARFYLAFDDLVAHWRATLPADRFREVAYEDVVADPEGQARALLAWLDLPWDEAVLAPHENAKPVATASAAQVRRPIYATSVGRWRRYGDRLKPLIDILVAGGVTG